MYSVFIVDDEMIVREGIRNRVDWEKSGFSFAGEAGDGEIALSMIQDVKPDILITDIRMPFMDGLELAANVKKIQPWIKIIILSGHDEFEYAKKAISIGVEDYILKPFTLEEIQNCLKKVAQTLDKEKQQFSDFERLKDELSSAYLLSREKFLSDLVMGTLDSSTAVQKAQEFGISLLSHYYGVIVCNINVKDDDLNTLVQIKSRVLNGIGEGVSGFFIAPNIFVGIVKGSDKKAVEESEFSLAGTVQHTLSKDGGCNVITGIGSTVEHISDITASFKEASAIIKDSRLTDRNKIISSDDIGKDDDSSIVLQENDPLVDRLNYADESEIDQIITEYIALLGENTGHFSIIASYLLVDVIMAVSKVIEDLGGNVKEVMPEILSHSFVDDAVQSEDVFIERVKDILTRLLEYRNSHVSGRYASVILRAKKFIDKNYMDPDLCLRSTAESVNFSPNHFSAIFSQECGTTFIEYLTSVRIAQAKKLLRTTDMKSADIGYEVGFNDPHYFSFLFKKVSGMSPREWRSSSAGESSSQ